MPLNTFTHFVPDGGRPQRLSDYLVGVFPVLPSRKGVKKAIKRERILVNGQLGTTGLYIKGGERIELKDEQPKPPGKVPELAIKVHLEDDHLAVVEKPAGLLTSGNKWMTLANALPAALEKSKAPDALPCPQPAHRLDYPTSGLVLVGKTATSLVHINRYFAERKIQKTYHAVAIRNLPTSGSIDLEIDKKVAETHFERLAQISSDRFGHLNLVKLLPTTGRRHQLRIHLAALGCPVLGDREHGLAGLILQGKGLYLHASQLRFFHPITGAPLLVDSSLPKKFHKLFADGPGK